MTTMAIKEVILSCLNSELRKHTHVLKGEFIYGISAKNNKLMILKRNGKN